MKEENKFWLHKTLDSMSDKEWESLCDGCGKCCLEKLEDTDTGVVYTTSITCRLLNTETCQCSSYNERFRYVDDCIKLTPNMVKTVKWLPKTCAYRLVNEKKDLPNWHPLYHPNINKRGKNSTVLSGNSASEFAVHPTLQRGTLLDYIISEE